MKDTSDFKKRLEEERDRLVKELNALGATDPNKPGDWEVKTPEMDVSTSDENELADRAEELHIDSIVLDELEARHQSVVDALKNIENGTYGVCTTCASPIEEDRLGANPAAATCKAHMNA